MLADNKGHIWIFWGGGQQPFTRLCIKLTILAKSLLKVELQKSLWRYISPFIKDIGKFDQVAVLSFSIVALNVVFVTLHICQMLYFFAGWEEEWKSHVNGWLNNCCLKPQRTIVNLIVEGNSYIASSSIERSRYSKQHKPERTNYSWVCHQQVRSHEGAFEGSSTPNFLCPQMLLGQEKFPLNM